MVRPARHDHADRPGSRLRRAAPGGRLAGAAAGAGAEPAPDAAAGGGDRRLLARPHRGGSGGLRRRPRDDAGPRPALRPARPRAHRGAGARRRPQRHHRLALPAAGSQRRQGVGHPGRAAARRLRAHRDPRRRPRVPPARPAPLPAGLRRGAGRRRLRLPLRWRPGAPGPALPPRAGQPAAHLPHQPGDQREPDRHGDLLQGGPHHAAPLHPPGLRRLPARAGVDHQAGQARGAHLRGAHQLLGAHLPGGEEDRLARRLPRALSHPAFLVVRPHLPGGRLGLADPRPPGAGPTLQRLDGRYHPPLLRPAHPRDRLGYRQPDPPAGPARPVRRLGHQPALPADAAGTDRRPPLPRRHAHRRDPWRDLSAPRGRLRHGGLHQRGRACRR